MNQKKKSKLSYMVLILIIAVVVFTVIRICTNTTKNLTCGISGKADDYIQMVDACYLELELDAPVAGMTGFSFRFEGNQDNFKDAEFLITAAIQNDSMEPQMLYENRVLLIEQAYDYQSENYIVIIPFKGDIQQGDHLRIAIMGMGMSEEDDILVIISSQTGIDGATFEINDAGQDSILAGTFYYQIRKLNVFPILMQGIVGVLFVLLIGELLANVKAKDKNKTTLADIRQVFDKKNILKLLPIIILLVAILDYAFYAGVVIQMQDSDLSNKTMLLLLMFGILVIGLTVVIFFCGLNKMKWEKLLFLTIVCLGILFEIAITPFAVPDEASHIDTAYRISNEMLGIEDTGIMNAIYKRECDIYTDSGVKRTIGWDTYKWIYNDWSNTERNRSVKPVFAADNRRIANSLFFLPVAVGITIGRMLGLGFVPMIYLARTANLLLAAWLIYLAVRKIPYGKSILGVIALLPITLQEIASCSYDALIISISMLYVSYCVFVIYSKEKLERIDVLVILITAVMLGICKGGVYTPLYLLLLWMLARRGYIRFPQKKGIRMAGMAAVTFAVLAGIVGVVYLYRQPIDANSLIGGRYSLTYLIRHPWETFRIIENTLYRGIYDYTQQLFGSALGCFQISAKFIVPIGYMILLERNVICSEKCPYIPNVLDKCVFMVTAILVFAAVLAAFLLEGTAFGSYAIEGVQGRYFLPMTWLFLICFRRSNVVYTNKNYTGFVLAGYLLGICMVLQIVIGALNPNM